MTIPEMADEIQIQPTSSSEVLELLLGAGLGRAQASALVGNIPQGQRPEDCDNQRPTIPSHPGSQSIQSSLSRSEFKRTVMETMQHLGRRLDSLPEKMEGSNDRDMITESPATSGSATTHWADRPLDEPLDSLPIPQWD